jgi:hypothetical protein
VLGIYDLLSAIMVERKDSTSNEDYLVVAKELFEKKEDLKILHIMDRFSLTDYFWLTLGFTKIVNVSLTMLTTY